MRFVIITGLSGSGKTAALKHMEDMGFFCVDNLPPVLLPQFADLCFSGTMSADKVAVVIDIRGREFFSGLVDSLKHMDDNNQPFEVLFLYASDDVLVQRYNFTRRIHPLSVGGRTLDGIHMERELLLELAGRATAKIDTTKLTSKELAEVLYRYYGDKKISDSVRLSIVSFGFKRGIPSDIDMVFDARFLPNPYNVEHLRRLCGKDKPVNDYLNSFSEVREFYDKIYGFISFLLPLYRRSGKRDLVIAVGCTGGMHRSVAAVENLAQRFINDGIPVYIEHRDLENEKIGVLYSKAVD